LPEALINQFQNHDRPFPFHDLSTHAHVCQNEFLRDVSAFDLNGHQIPIPISNLQISSLIPAGEIKNSVDFSRFEWFRKL